MRQQGNYSISETSKQILIPADGELIKKKKNETSTFSEFFRPENVFLLNPDHLDLVIKKGLVPKKKKRGEQSLFLWRMVWPAMLLLVFSLLLIIAISWLLGVFLLVSIVIICTGDYIGSHKKTWQINKMVSRNAQLLRGRVVDFRPSSGRDRGYIKYAFRNPQNVNIVGTMEGVSPHYSVIKTYKNRWQQKTIKVGTNVAVLYLTDTWYIIL